MPVLPRVITLALPRGIGYLRGISSGLAGRAASVYSVQAPKSSGPHARPRSTP
ncbi:hypothetical protein AURDEDRAFT_115670 [Auricularia subglabra TFB-10046 SS5]|uniref:Uncharacterized protein n=1 Tax=Auricularia subglabra (strain TFB-10046 / SS5) TaxID=717982 RepID=J0WX03_AURST|nr:hypothetical protein AURDEDRAFT_115670 [Auricularia subglabra TFB-10046 SS5]